MQVDTITPVWGTWRARTVASENSRGIGSAGGHHCSMSFRCCRLDAKVTVRFMYRHAGMSKKEKDLLIGAYSCPLQTKLDLMRQMKDEKPFSVPLESAESIKRREKAQAEAAVAAASMHRHTLDHDVQRVPSGAAMQRIPSGVQASNLKRMASGGSEMKRMPSGGSVASAGSVKKKKNLSLRGAVDAVLATTLLVHVCVCVCVCVEYSHSSGGGSSCNQCFSFFFLSIHFPPFFFSTFYCNHCVSGASVSPTLQDMPQPSVFR